MGACHVCIAAQVNSIHAAMEEHSTNDVWFEPRATGAMSAHEFRDDVCYLAWLAGHPDRYVINIARSHNASEACLHHARCRTINGPHRRRKARVPAFFEFVPSNRVVHDRHVREAPE
jgi:hypothetical protein